MSQTKPISERDAIPSLTTQQQIDAAFWSKRLRFREWKRQMTAPEQHLSTALHALAWMPASFLLDQLGEQWFIKRWPILRGEMVRLEGDLFTSTVSALDAIWGAITLGDAQYRPKKIFSTLSKGRLELLRYLIANPGETTYAAARALGRDYSRVHKEIHWLETHNLVVRGEVEQGANHVPRVPLYVRDSLYSLL